MSSSIAHASDACIYFSFSNFPSTQQWYVCSQVDPACNSKCRLPCDERFDECALMYMHQLISCIFLMPFVHIYISH